MDKKSGFRIVAALIIAGAVITGSVLICSHTLRTKNPDYWKPPGEGPRADISSATGTVFIIPTQSGSKIPPPPTPGGPSIAPTPDSPHPLPTISTETRYYTVNKGDTLGTIAKEYGVSVEQIMEANNLKNPNVLDVGQKLTIPPPIPDAMGPAVKIIPDSELVFSPYTIYFNTEDFIKQQDGYIVTYTEDVGGVVLSSAEIINKIAQDYSVNPRILLAVLEYKSHWLSDPNPKKEQRKYPIGIENDNLEGLYLQLSWAANNLNRGYYLWRVNGIGTWLLDDGTVVPIAPTINAGTAGVQQMFALISGRPDWEKAVGEKGVLATYTNLFGYPFTYAFEPLIPPNLIQPPMQLPFEPGKEWAFTGGPHGGWGDGSAWAALDFAPPGDAYGCVQSNEWVVAVADGYIVRAGNGAVIQDLDGDGFEQTGWVVLYMHIETRDRVEPGTYVRAGEKIGHPSCEGGIANGTHVHLARRYNGEWIPADQDIPFRLDGWVSQGTGTAYDGYLERAGHLIEAFAGNSPTNTIQR